MPSSHLYRSLLCVVLLVVPATAQAHTVPGAPRALRASRARPAPRVIGGSSAVGSTLGMVARIVDDDGDGEGFLCSGTVVSADVVLTAGHCGVDIDTGVTDSPGGYTVTTGTQTVQGAGQVSGVSDVIPYPGFDPSTLSGDAALLVLSTPTTVTPVALASASADAGLYAGGATTAITGWGVDDGDGDLPDELLYGFDVVQSAAYCDAQAQALDVSFDPDTELCAVDAPNDADGVCHGDSGGPMLAVVNATWVEMGLTSFGPDDCDPGVAAFFTRTDAIAPWIESEIAAHPVTAASPAPTPAPTAAPAAPAGSPPAAPTASPAPVRAGSYRGQTSQHEPISLRASGTDGSASRLTFGFVLRCARHPPLAYTFAPRLSFPLGQGGAFASRFDDSGGTAYRVVARFSATGSVGGTLQATWRTRRLGRCTTGPVSWTASQVG